MPVPRYISVCSFIQLSFITVLSVGGFFGLEWGRPWPQAEGLITVLAREQKAEGQERWDGGRWCVCVFLLGTGIGGGYMEVHQGLTQSSCGGSWGPFCFSDADLSRSTVYMIYNVYKSVLLLQLFIKKPTALIWQLKYWSNIKRSIYFYLSKEWRI